MVAFRRAIVIIATGTLGFTGFAGTSFAQTAASATSDELSARVGRLAYLQGTVSFHDNDQSDWQPALLNSPITAGDALWTEPKARSEVSIAGTRVRMDSATMLKMVALDDRLTRMELEQGRVDIKTFNYDNSQPYEVVTPRGIVTIQEQGDYYVEAGSTQDPTRLGVRVGAAQLAIANGQTVAVRAGEVVEISGDGSAPQLSTIKTAPPPMPTQWAERDRQVSYDKPPQYLSTNVTGYEELNHYGTWQNDPEYGQVWHVNSPPAGWAPYTTGRWVSDRNYGWTWVDEQPWGFAPYHYGRWAQRNDRWFWVPPDRQQPAVYAPALVAFIGGVELGQILGVQNRQPVGWFPLGPREVYVPPYSMNRDYYRRINFSARVQQNILEDRWARFERREALREDEQRQMWMNRRFARVVAADDFARSRPVQRALLRIAADKLAAAPVAPIAAPPRPNESIRALLERREDRRDAAREDRRDAQRAEDRREDRRDAQRVEDRREDRRDNTRSGDADRRPSMVGLQPVPEKAKAPGPQIASRRDARTDDKTEANKSDDDRKDAKQALPQLAPRNAAAPPQPKLEGDRRAVNDDKRPGQATTPQRADQPNTGPAAADRTDGRDRANQRDQQPGQANLPPVRDRNEQRPERPHADDAQRNEPNRPPVMQPPRPAEANRPEPQRPGEPPRPADAQRPGQPPQPNQATQPQRPEPPKPGENRATPPQQATPQPTRPVEPPKPPQAQAVPQPPRPAEPPKPQQAEPPKPKPQAQPPERQGQAVPAPQPPRQAPPAPPPQQVQRPAPPPQVQQAPPPQQVQRPAPPPQVQHAPPPQQAQAPRPAPPPQQQQQQAPRPAPQPQQAQAPHPTPAPQQSQAPQQQPRPQQGQQNNNNNNDKK